MLIFVLPRTPGKQVQSQRVRQDGEKLIQISCGEGSTITDQGTREEKKGLFTGVPGDPVKRFKTLYPKNQTGYRFTGSITCFSETGHVGFPGTTT